MMLAVGDMRFELKCYRQPSRKIARTGYIFYLGFMTQIQFYLQYCDSAVLPFKGVVKHGYIQL